MIYSGKLTEFIRFIEINEQQSDSGFQYKTENILMSCRAERLKNKENYVVDADELFHTTELTFRLRYVNGLNENLIVEYEGERYRITSFNKNKTELTIIVAKINE